LLQSKLLDTLFGSKFVIFKITLVRWQKCVEHFSLITNCYFKVADIQLGKCTNIRKIQVPLYRNVARCWAYETSVALEADLSNSKFETIDLFIF
jgi:hypothetical protein